MSELRKELVLNIAVQESTRIRQKRKGFSSFLKEIVSGWFPSGDKSKHPLGVEKYREINKEKHSYKEVVIDKSSGKKTRDAEEDLLKHR